MWPRFAGISWRQCKFLPLRAAGTEFAQFLPKPAREQRLPRPEYPPKEGSLFPKMGNSFPPTKGNGNCKTAYAAAVSEALRRELGETRRAIKTVMRWTGSNERTVKNWIAGTNGPSGENLVILARHSYAVMTAFQQLSGRTDDNADSKLVRQKLVEAIELLDGTYQHG